MPITSWTIAERLFVIALQASLPADTAVDRTLYGSTLNFWRQAGGTRAEAAATARLEALAGT